ncbi:VOC family protein [Chloroflexota bacterium]
MEPVVIARDCTRVGVVVRDMEKAIDFYSQTFGWGPWDRFYAKYPPDTGTTVTLRGKPVSYEGPRALVKLGEIMFEFIEPHGESCLTEFLASNSGGLHHLGFDVDDLSGAIAKLEKAGISPLEAEKDENGKYRWAYVSVLEATGSNIVIELAQRPRLVEPAKRYSRVFMASSERPLVVTQGCNHIGVVNRDMEKDKEFFSRIFGWAPWDLGRQNHTKRVKGDGVTLRGEPCEFEGDRFHFRLGQLYIEFEETPHGKSMQTEFLDSNSGGLLYCMFHVDDALEAIANLEKAGIGVPFLQAVQNKQGKYTNVHTGTQEFTGTNLVVGVAPHSAIETPTE